MNFHLNIRCKTDLLIDDIAFTVKQDLRQLSIRTPTLLDSVDIRMLFKNYHEIRRNQS